MNTLRSHSHTTTFRQCPIVGAAAGPQCHQPQPPRSPGTNPVPTPTPPVVLEQDWDSAALTGRPYYELEIPAVQADTLGAAIAALED